MRRIPKILAIDDEPAILRMVQKTLNSSNKYQCEISDTSSDALQKINSFHPDLVLTDYNMPQLDGLGLLKKVQELGQSIGVIIMTGSLDIEPAIEALKSGADEYLIKPFTNDILLMSLARVIEKRDLIQKNEQYQAFVEKAFRRYVDPTVLNILTDSPDYGIFESRKLTASVFFCDIRGFSDMVSEFEVDQLISKLNEFYFEPATEIIMAHGGTVDKFIGDGIMAIFGAPQPFDDFATKAVEAALDMVQRIETSREKNLHRFQIGIGIATGEVFCGNIGGPKRMDFTVMGNTVNLAARLEKVAGANMILIDEQTRQLVGNKFEVSGGIDMFIKGQKSACRVFQVRPEAKDEMPLFNFAEG
jgi:adenylate cyclase